MKFDPEEFVEEITADGAEPAQPVPSRGNGSMDHEAYDHAGTIEEIITGLRTYALLAGSADLEQAARTIATADAVGFVVNPTLYRARLQDGGLERQRRLVALAQHIRDELAAIWPHDPLMEIFLSHR